MNEMIRRFVHNPIIYPEMDASIGYNINGPSLIKVPRWIENPLGRYYLYFAHHEGSYIRLAYADDLDGPWKIYKPGTLTIDQTPCVQHIASPDVHIDYNRKQIRMYYHGPIQGVDPDTGQVTFVATSNNGIDFDSNTNILGDSYFRVFQWKQYYYALVMPGFFARSKDGFKNFEYGPRLFTENMRHSAVYLLGEKLFVFYSNVKDNPEHIILATIHLDDDWMHWEISKSVSLIKPKHNYEGADLPARPSGRGPVNVPVRQLRDPGIYEEDGKVYLLYSIAGERGIAIAEIDFDLR